MELDLQHGSPDSQPGAFLGAICWLQLRLLTDLRFLSRNALCLHHGDPGLGLKRAHLWIQACLEEP